MANLYTQFSDAIGPLTEERRDWFLDQVNVNAMAKHLLQAAIESKNYREALEYEPAKDLVLWPEYVGTIIPRHDRAELNQWDVWRDYVEDYYPGFELEIEQFEGGEFAWFYAEEAGRPGNVAELVQEFLAKFDPESAWTTTYAETCDKMRLGEFSGGAVFVTAEGDRVHGRARLGPTRSSKRGRRRIHARAERG